MNTYIKMIMNMNMNVMKMNTKRKNINTNMNKNIMPKNITSLLAVGMQLEN